MDNFEIGLRLDGIAQNLGIGKHWKGPPFEELAIAACVERVRKAIDLSCLTQSEDVAQEIAKCHQVRFAEIKNDSDLIELERFYLYEQKELSFGLLRDEIMNPRVDALLIQRKKAELDAPDRWIAVLNSLRTTDRAFWNKFHELGHRVSESPQMILPLTVRRETSDNHNTLERLIDRIAGEIAFLPELVEVPLKELTRSGISFQAVETFRMTIAPTASLLSTMNAVIKRCTQSALAFYAEIRPRASGDIESIDLRITPQGRSYSAVHDNLCFFYNMRVPHESSVWQTFQDGIPRTELESMTCWKTSDGSRLKWNKSVISTVRVGRVVYSTMEIIS